MSEINTNLIAAVCAKPLLWDQKNKDYYNRHVLDKNWNEIAKQLKMNVHWVRKRWKQLRDTFRLELKKLPPQHTDDSVADGCSDSYSSWPYFNQMGFIKSQIRSRKSFGNFSKQNTIRENNSTKEDVFNDDDDNHSSNDMEVYTFENQSNKRKYYDSETAFEVETLKTTPQSQKKIGKHFDRNSEIRYIEVKNPQEENSKYKIENNDEDMAFFISLLPHVKNMSPPEKLLCRMDIQATVFNHAYGKSSSSSSSTRTLNYLPLNGHNTLPMSSYSNTTVSTSILPNNECERVNISPEQQTTSVPTQYPIVEFTFSPKQEV